MAAASALEHMGPRMVDGYAYKLTRGHWEDVVVTSEVVRRAHFVTYRVIDGNRMAVFRHGRSTYAQLAHMVARDNPMSSAAQLALVAGLAVVVIGGGIAIAVAASKPAAAAPTPKPGHLPAPAPPPVPVGAGFTTPITDPATVTQYQTVVANGVADPTYTGPPVTYAITNVNGNPSDPTWMAALAIIQRYINTDGGGIDPTKVPPGFPIPIRTDGVLDYATAIVFANG